MLSDSREIVVPCNDILAPVCRAYTAFTRLLSLSGIARDLEEGRDDRLPDVLDILVTLTEHYAMTLFETVEELEGMLRVPEGEPSGE